MSAGKTIKQNDERIIRSTEVADTMTEVVRSVRAKLESFKAEIEAEIEAEKAWQAFEREFDKNLPVEEEEIDLWN